MFVTNLQVTVDTIQNFKVIYKIRLVLEKELAKGKCSQQAGKALED